MGTAAVEAWTKDAPVPVADLRRGLATLGRHHGARLGAVCVSSDDGAVDLDDVLVRAVGVDALAVVGASGVLLERSFLDPLPAPAPGLSGRHVVYRRYELTTHAGPTCWSIGRPVAAFSTDVAGPVDAGTVRRLAGAGDVDDVELLCVRARLELPAVSDRSPFTVTSVLSRCVPGRVVAVDVRAEAGPAAVLTAELYEATMIHP